MSYLNTCPRCGSKISGSFMSTSSGSIWRFSCFCGHTWYKPYRPKATSGKSGGPSSGTVGAIIGGILGAGLGPAGMIIGALAGKLIGDEDPPRPSRGVCLNCRNTASPIAVDASGRVSWACVNCGRRWRSKGS